MPDELPHIEFSEGWVAFISALRRLWHEETIGPRAHLGYYMTLRDQALRAASEAGFVNAIQEAWLVMRQTDRGRMSADLLLIEITSFTDAVSSLPKPPQAADVQATQEAPPEDKKRNDQRRDLLGDASTVLDSIKDLFENLPGWAKSTLIILREIADLLRRK